MPWGTLLGAFSRHRAKSDLLSGPIRGELLGAEGLAADVTMLVGNGYVPGHAAYALELLRAEPGVRRLFEGRLSSEVDA